MDNRTRLFLVLPLVMAVIMAVVADHVPFGTALNDTASEIVSFVPQELKIRERPVSLVHRGLQGPFDFSAAAKGEGINPDGPASPDQGTRRGLSLIVTGEDQKMAIIEGRLVKEGDKVDDKRVARIEADRILLKDRTMQWKYMEEEK